MADVRLEQVAVLEAVVETTELADEARLACGAAGALEAHVTVAGKLQVVVVRTLATGLDVVELLLTLLVTGEQVHRMVAVAPLELAGELGIHVEVRVPGVDRVRAQVREFRNGRRGHLVVERIARREVEVAIVLVVRLELRAKLEAVLECVAAERVDGRRDPARLHVAFLAQQRERIERALAVAVRTVRIECERRGWRVVQHAELRVALAARTHCLLVHQREVGLRREPLGDVEVRIAAHRITLVVVLGVQDALLVEVVTRQRQRGEVVAARDAERVVRHRRRLVDEPEPVRVGVLDRVEAERGAVDVARGVLGRLAEVRVDRIDRIQLGADVHALRHVLRALRGDVSVVRDLEAAGVAAATGLDDHDAVRSACAVDGSGRCVLEHRHALDVERIEVVDLADHAIHEDERAIVAEGGRAADADRRAVRTRTSAEVLHRDAGHEALKALRDVRHGALGDLVTSHDLGGTGDVCLDLSAVARRHDDAFELRGRAAEAEVRSHGLSVVDADGLFGRTIAEEPNANDVRASGDAAEGILARHAAASCCGGTIDKYAGARYRHAKGVEDGTADDSRALTEGDGRHSEQPDGGERQEPAPAGLNRGHSRPHCDGGHAVGW